MILAAVQVPLSQPSPPRPAGQTQRAVLQHSSGRSDRQECSPVCSSCCGQQQASLLWYWLISLFFFSCEMRFSIEMARGCCQPKYHPSLCSIFQSFICLLVKLGQMKKSASSESNPVQSSISKYTMCPKKGCLTFLRPMCCSISIEQKLW